MKFLGSGVLEICAAGVLGLRMAYSARSRGDNRSADRRDEPHINLEREYCSPEYIRNRNKCTVARVPFYPSRCLYVKV